jgi:hypothetical protein
VVVGIDLRLDLGERTSHSRQSRGVNIGQMMNHLGDRPSPNQAIKRGTQQIVAQKRGKTKV